VGEGIYICMCIYIWRKGALDIDTREKRRRQSILVFLSTVCRVRTGVRFCVAYTGHKTTQHIHRNNKTLCTHTHTHKHTHTAGAIMQEGLAVLRVERITVLDPLSLFTTMKGARSGACIFRNGVRICIPPSEFQLRARSHT